MGELAKLGERYQAEIQLQLLGGRLVVDMPRGAFVEPMAPSLMGAPASPEVETRVVLDHGGERLVMMANETFQRSPDAIRPAVEALAAKWGSPGGSGLKVFAVPTPKGSSFEIVAVARAPLDLSRSAVPIMDAFIRHPDSTVQRLAIYVSPNAADDGAGCGLLAFEMLRTLEIGSRPLVTSHGSRSLNGHPGGPDLSVSVPNGWIATTKRGPDFVVHTLYRLMPFDGPFASVHVYVGRHPAPLHRQYPAACVTRTSGVLLNQNVDWYTLRSDEAGQPPVFRLEALVGVPGSSDRVVLHVFSETDNPSMESEIKAIAASIKAAVSAAEGAIHQHGR
jgi:hypothetical protein